MSAWLEMEVRKRLGSFELELNLELPRVNVVALFGPSGAGKSSLINFLAGLLRPDRGRIVVQGRVLFDSREGIDLPPHRRRVGYVFQDARLLPHLTVVGNLNYGRRWGGSGRGALDLDEVVELLDLGHLRKRYPANLSGGEKQRVAIGRALLCDPQLLLMDEPLASLDRARKEELLPFIARLSRVCSIPIVYVSHSWEEIARLADTVVVMEEGRVVAVEETDKAAALVAGVGWSSLGQG